MQSLTFTSRKLVERKAREVGKTQKEDKVPAATEQYVHMNREIFSFADKSMRYGLWVSMFEIKKIKMNFLLECPSLVRRFAISWLNKFIEICDDYRNIVKIIIEITVY